MYDEPEYRVRRIVKTHGDVVWRLYTKTGVQWRRHNKQLEFDSETEAHGHAEIWLTGYARADTHYV